MASSICKTNGFEIQTTQKTMDIRPPPPPPRKGASDSYMFSFVNNKMLESDWFLTAHIYSLIITITEFSNLIGYQLSWFQQ